jgi:hypothetical protein
VLCLEAEILIGSLDSNKNDPFVTRAAAESLGRHPRWSEIKYLLDALSQVPASDTHLQQVLKMALRDSVAVAETQEKVWMSELELSDDDLKLLASISLGVHSPAAAKFLVGYLETHDDNRMAYVQHAARYADEGLVPKVIEVARTRAGEDIFAQGQVIQALAAGLAQRKDPDVSIVTMWAESVAAKLLAANDADAPRKQQLAADLVRKLKVRSLRPQLTSLVAGSTSISTTSAKS